MSSKKIGLSLRGGGTNATYYLGAIKCLLDNNIEVHSLLVASGGACVGVPYAFGNDIDRIASEFANFQISKYMSWRNPMRGIVSAHKLTDFFRQFMSFHKLSESKIEIVVRTTNHKTGKKFLITDHDAAESMYMSSTVPILFEKMQHHGNALVDGELSEINVDDHFKSRGIDLSIEFRLNLSRSKLTLDAPLHYFKHTYMRAMGYNLADSTGSRPDLTIAFTGTDEGFLNSGESLTNVASGYQQMASQLPALLKLL